jgi:hypothetical protein
MEAKEYLDLLKDEKAIIRLAHFEQDKCDGRGYAVILDETHQIAVMLEHCGDSSVRAGNLVKYVIHPEAEPKIVGTPASICS